MICTCGKELKENAKFCTECGKSIEAIINENSKLNTDTTNESQEQNIQNVTESNYIIEDDTTKQEQLESLNNETENIESNNINNDESFDTYNNEPVNDYDNNVNNNEPFNNYDNNINNNEPFNQKKKNSSKKIFAVTGAFLGVLAIALLVFIFTRPDYKIVNADYASYPYLTLTVEDGKGKFLEDTEDVSFYQDDKLIEDYEYEGDGDYIFKLDSSIEKGDATNITVKNNKNDEVLASKKYSIKSTIFDNLFDDIEVVSDDYPKIEILADADPRVEDFGIFDDMTVNVNGVDYESTYELDEDYITIYVDLSGSKRERETNIDINYTMNDEDVVVGAVLELEPLNNVNIEYIKSDYSEYPIVRQYVNFYDKENNNINAQINTKELSFYDITNSGQSPIEIVNTTRMTEGGKVSVELIADVSGSIGDSGLIESQNSLLTFINLVQFDKGDEAELISFSDWYYEEQRFSNNKTKLDRAIRELELGGGTALYDTLMHGLERTVIQRGSKFIVATTDGMDNASYESSYDDVIRSANEFNIPIYIIGIGDSIDTSVLANICESTGGEFIQLQDFNSLRDSFDKIYQKERDGFVIEYNVENLAAEEDDILLSLDGNVYGGEIELDYDPIFVSWGGNVRVDDPNTPYDERNFDSNYYDSTHRYEVVFEDVSWQEANRRAVAKGGYLARITSEEEFDVIVDRIKSSTSSKSYSYWLGGSRKKSYDDTYAWVDSDLEVKSGTIPENAWLPGEPSYYEHDSNGNALFEEEYLNMFYVANYDKWFLNDCIDDLLANYDTFKGKIAYVIEYDK